MSAAIHLGVGAPLLLVHGYGARPADLQPTAEALAGDFEVVVADWALPRRRWRLSAALEELHAALRSCRGDRAIVVGHSFGGALAVELAARHPQHVGHLVLVDSLAQSERLTFLKRIAGVGEPPAPDEGQADRRDERVEQASEDPSGGSSAVAFLRTWGRAPLNLSAAALWGFFSDRQDAMASVRRADIRRTVLWGHGDTILQPTDGQRFARRFDAPFHPVQVPSSRVRHQWPIRHAELFADVLRDAVS